MKKTAIVLLLMKNLKCAAFLLLAATQCLLISSSLFSQIPGNALELDGLDDYIEIANPLPIGNISHTIECRVNVPLPGTKNYATDRSGRFYETKIDNQADFAQMPIFSSGGL